MDLNTSLKILETAGTAQNRKIYRRHGVTEPLYGVSYADLGKITKQIKTDHFLAIKLWETGNHDARILATMVADPGQLTSELIDCWVLDLTNYVTTGAFAKLVGQSDFAENKMLKWIKSAEEWIGRTGWLLLAGIAQDENNFSDDYFEAYLQPIETGIHSAPNRVRDAMNSALIAIGIRNHNLKAKAQTLAKQIGKVEVDHGQTGCKTPDACQYIDKTWTRKNKA